MTCVQKRSYKRACRRAIMHGFADYHGRRLQLQDFPSSLIQKVRDTGHHNPRVQPTFTRGSRAQRYTTMFWNAGGLSQAMFQELKQWLRSHPVGIVIIAETRWGFETHWSDTEWSYLHSTTETPRSGGLLVMLARSLATPTQIGFDSIVPGRLLHVRVHGDKRAFDLLALYQYTDYRTESSTKQRATVWNALDDCLRALPRRNHFLCAGDFNCDLRAQPPWVGVTQFLWNHQPTQGSTHKDQNRLQDLLRTHGLTALNTWDRSGASA